MDGYTKLGWDLAVLVFFWLIVPTLVIGAVLLTWGQLAMRRDQRKLDKEYTDYAKDRNTYGYGMQRARETEVGGARSYWGAGLLVWSLVIAFIATVGFVPFKTKYVSWYQVDDTVVSVSNTFADSSGTITTTPVVMLKGLHMPVTISDPRVVTMEELQVELACQPTWHYHAADTIHCRLIAYGAVL